MLLFSDGFENFHADDLWRKWGSQCAPWGTGAVDDTKARIVHGTDYSVNPPKPYAKKDGRALYVANSQYFDLGTTFRPSRTLFFGFAARGFGGNRQCRIVIDFAAGCPAIRPTSFGAGTTREYDQAFPVGGDPNRPAAVMCILDFYNSYINIEWRFLNTATKVGRIDLNYAPNGPDFHYFQGGFTLLGNVPAQPQAWAEVRVGHRDIAAHRYRHENILTTGTDANQLFYVNGMGLHVSGHVNYGGNDYGGMIIDDFYLCNDEGEANNTFLGAVNIRRRTAIAEGTINNAVPYGSVMRSDTVNEAFISGNSLPGIIPDPEQDPLFIPWESCDADYFTLMKKGDKQLIRFTHTDFQGAIPKIHGVILHALCNATEHHYGMTTGLLGIRKNGVNPFIESTPIDYPIVKMGEFSAFRFPFDNRELPAAGQQYAEWNASVVNESEWGFELQPVVIDPQMYDPQLVRFNVTFHNLLTEVLSAIDSPSRYIEENPSEMIGFADVNNYQYTWAVNELLAFVSDTDFTKSGQRFLNETLYLTEAIPWTYLFVGDFLEFADAVWLAFMDSIDETMDVSDWSDGFWEELFNDGIGLADQGVFTYIEMLDEILGLEEPYLWDGHELVEEELGVNVPYLWDNHELMEETLYAIGSVEQGIGLYVGEAFGLVEDHFDGRLVEQPDDWLGLGVSILTQHWRYERFWGVVIDSQQVVPIEQQGNDGNHTGDNPWGA